jgi:hypothetical protein
LTEGDARTFDCWTVGAWLFSRAAECGMIDLGALS